jgi:hypothetical protein
MHTLVDGVLSSLKYTLLWLFLKPQVLTEDIPMCMKTPSLQTIKLIDAIYFTTPVKHSTTPFRMLRTTCSFTNERTAPSGIKFSL